LTLISKAKSAIRASKITFVITASKAVFRFFSGTLFEGQAEFTLRIKVLSKSNTLQSKILLKMARDRDPRLTLFADKWLARNYVSSVAGSANLSETFGFYEEFPNTRPKNIPRNFVAKANHGSGGVVLIWDGAPRGGKIEIDSSNPWKKLIINPDDLDWAALKDYFDIVLKENYYWHPGKLPEWAYINIIPGVFFEEFIFVGGAGPAEDFKFFMVNGKCEIIQHDIDRYESHKRNLYNAKWRRLHAKSDIVDNYEPSARKPTMIEEGLHLANLLSAGVDFVRVDLYLTDTKVIFGELTNYPDAGKVPFRPKQLMKTMSENCRPTY
jgi:hypothetical protein